MIQSLFMMSRLLLSTFILVLPWFLNSCSSNPKNKPFKLLWPADKNVISRGYTGEHDGIDIAVPSGTAVYAAHKGKVAYSGYAKGYGYYVIVEFSKQWGTLYAHLSKALVQKGEMVQARQKIGLSGATGIVTGAHLHFELFKDKENVNPIPYLKN